jgi:hypothetical protein
LPVRHIVPYYGLKLFVLSSTFVESFYWWVRDYNYFIPQTYNMLINIYKLSSGYSNSKLFLLHSTLGITIIKGMLECMQVYVNSVSSHLLLEKNQDEWCRLSNGKSVTAKQLYIQIIYSFWCAETLRNGCTSSN